MDEEALAKALQAARKSAGLTQQELCQKAGLSYSTLAKIERGAIKAPSIFTIHSIADALDLSLNELLGGIIPDKPKKKQSLTGIKFVYFDIDGCLTHSYQSAFMRIAEDTGQSTDMIETTYWHYHDALCRGDMTVSELNDVLREQLEAPELDWAMYYREAATPIQDMHEALVWASEHYQVGLFSNSMPGMIAQLLEYGLLPRVAYDVVVDSSQEGLLKPQPELFELAADRSECDTPELLLVDGSRANITTAERLGWRVMWFDALNPAAGAQRVRDALRFAD